MTSPLKIYPTIEECQIKNKLTCPMENCGQNFTSESNLNLHLAKTHRAVELKCAPVEKWYFCPEEKCPWAGTKHFKNMKTLRQHFLKMHLAKMFPCLGCNKAFQTGALLAKHSQFCDVSFNCLDCKAFYSRYDTLKTHCRRKKHRLLNKLEYKVKHAFTEARSDVFLVTSDRLIAPRKCASEEMLTRTVDSQTLTFKPKIETKTTQIGQVAVTQVTQQTQTGTKNSVFSVETQTTENPKIKHQCEEDNFKNINTQTDIVESRETSCNTSFDLDEFECTIRSDISKNSSSTQTYWPGDIFDMSTSTHGNIHTDTSDLLSDSLSNFDTNFFNCNTETQTDFMFENEMFNSDYYSNMYTQTCDEILSDLNGFTDIQTQTVLHETLRSVESQTLMSSTDKLCPNILKDIVHSETQTDAEFRQMLEIINS